MKRFNVLQSLAVFFLFSQIAWGAVPQLINFQGVLKDSAGNPPAVDMLDVTFTIYDAPLGGSALWTETQSITIADEGRFNILLGSSNPVPDSVFADTVRYMGIKVATDPELSPRQRLASVGYSYRVNSVDGASGGTISGGLTLSGGNLNLDASSATAGNIRKGGALFIHNFGTDNTFIGLNAGNLTMTGGFNTAGGTDALLNNTTGSSNTAGGSNALFLNTTGNNNTASGSRALFSNTTGSANTASGSDALLNNTTGGSNTAGGREALRANTTGNSNTASGRNALRSNTTGSANTAIGSDALFSNTTGNFNTASGNAALYSNTTGISNTAIGYHAVAINIIGIFNTASGTDALVSNTTGSHNTASGWNALASNTIGNFNTASGRGALASNTTGSLNTASGSDALLSNTTGGSNTASGNGALYSNTTGNYNTASGNGALYSNTTGDYNTASGYQALYSNTTGHSNTASGYQALYSNTTDGVNNTASGLRALYSNTTGDYNTAIGLSADVSAGNLTNATAIGSFAIVDASNKIRLGSSSVTVIEGQVGFTASSDKNQKENFRPVNGEEVLRKIRGFELTSWNFIGHDPKQFRHYGPMAQDFFAAFGDDGIGKIGTETTLNSGDVAGILMIAVQALEKEKELLRGNMETIKSENQDLRKEMKELRELVRKLLAEERESGSTVNLNR